MIDFPSLHLGNCLEVLATLEAESYDAAVTDPPYELNFMGRAWDRSGIAFQADTWAAVYRVLRPGGYLLAFGGTRTYHRMAVAIEDAGFEIRDSIDWIYGTGFPKSVDAEREVARALCKEVGRHFLRKLPKESDRKPGDHVCAESDTSRRFLGIGSALKPAHEPIVVARKPFRSSLGANLLEHGTGGLHVEASKLAGIPPSVPQPAFGSETGLTYGMQTGEGRNGEMSESSGRWPPNVLLSHLPACRPAAVIKVRNRGGRLTGKEPSARTGTVYEGTRDRQAFTPHGENGRERVQAWLCGEGCPVAAVDAQGGQSETPSTVRRGSSSRRNTFNIQTPGVLEVPSYGDAGGASRFFPVIDLDPEDPDGLIFRYEPKADRGERDLGCESLPLRTRGETTRSKEDAARLNSPRTGAGRTSGARNHHPTVKPIALMRWLVRLVCAPGQRVIDPFMGSGTTGMAAKLEGVNFTGIEQDAENFKIAGLRVAAVNQASLLALAEDPPAEDLEPEPEQRGMFEEGAGDAT